MYVYTSMFVRAHIIQRVHLLTVTHTHTCTDHRSGLKLSKEKAKKNKLLIPKRFKTDMLSKRSLTVQRPRKNKKKKPKKKQQKILKPKHYFYCTLHSKDKLILCRIIII